MKKVLLAFLLILITAVASVLVSSYFLQVPNWINKGIYGRDTIISAEASKESEQTPVEEQKDVYTKLVVSKRISNNVTISQLSDYLDDVSYDYYNKYVESIAVDKVYTHVSDDVYGFRFGSSKGLGRLTLIFKENVSVKSVKLEYTEYREDEPVQYGNLIRNENVEFNAQNRTYTFEEPVDSIVIGYPDGLVGRFILNSISLEIVETDIAA